MVDNQLRPKERRWHSAKRAWDAHQVLWSSHLWWSGLHRRATSTRAHGAPCQEQRAAKAEHRWCGSDGRRILSLAWHHAMQSGLRRPISPVPSIAALCRYLNTFGLSLGLLMLWAALTPFIEWLPSSRPDWRAAHSSERVEPPTRSYLIRRNVALWSTGPVV